MIGVKASAATCFLIDVEKKRGSQQQRVQTRGKTKNQQVETAELMEVKTQGDKGVRQYQGGGKIG